MQVFALKDEKLIHVKDATPKVGYLCPECKAPVRLRSGKIRHPHFCHLSISNCSLSNKSAEHFATQLALQNLIGEIDLEMRFPAVSRIADAVWLDQQLVFEVQCSPISLEEVQAREFDYMSSGFTVVWILHTKTFDRTRPSKAEAEIRKKASAFANFDEHGNGGFYDHEEGGRLRLKRKPRLPICLNRPIRKDSNLYFHGDRMHIDTFDLAELYKLGLRKPSRWLKILMWAAWEELNPGHPVSVYTLVAKESRERPPLTDLVVEVLKKENSSEDSSSGGFSHYKRPAKQHSLVSLLRQWLNTHWNSEALEEPDSSRSEHHRHYKRK